MSVIDFTTWTEVDPNSHITVTSSRVTFASLVRNEDAYVYKDYGAAYWSGNFSHDFTLRIDSTGTDSGVIGCWVLANAVDDLKGLQDAAENFLCIQINTQAAVSVAYDIYLRERYSSTYYSDLWPVTAIEGTVYYCTVSRDEAVGTYGTLYLDIYSDSARTTLVKAFTVALHANLDFRYLYGPVSHNGALATTVAGYVENLDGGIVAATIEVGKVDFNFTGKVPTVINRIRTTVAVPNVNFNFTGKVPTVNTTTPILIPIPIATFNFSRFAPTIRTTDVGIAVGKATFNFTGQAPTVSVTGNSVIAVGKATFNFTGYAPSVQLTNTEEEINWGLFDTDGNPITGASPTIKIRSRATGYVLDWSDNTFKASGGSSPASVMPEMDATNFQGYYRKIFTMTGWSDGWYVAATTYSAGTPKQNGTIEFKVQDGLITEDYSSTNLDMAVSAVNTNVLARLAAADFIAPDNAGIGALPLLSEIEGSSILAKEATLAEVLAIVTLLKKYARNKRVIWKDPATGIKYLIIYDDNGTTELVRKSLKDPTAANIADLAVGSMATEEASSV